MVHTIPKAANTPPGRLKCCPECICGCRVLTKFTLLWRNGCDLGTLLPICAAYLAIMPTISTAPTSHYYILFLKSTLTSIFFSTSPAKARYFSNPCYVLVSLSRPTASVLLQHATPRPAFASFIALHAIYSGVEIGFAVEMDLGTET